MEQEITKTEIDKQLALMRHKKYREKDPEKMRAKWREASRKYYEKNKEFWKNKSRDYHALFLYSDVEVRLSYIDECMKDVVISSLTENECSGN